MTMVIILECGYLIMFSFMRWLFQFRLSLSNQRSRISYYTFLYDMKDTGKLRDIHKLI